MTSGDRREPGERGAVPGAKERPSAPPTPRYLSGRGPSVGPAIRFRTYDSAGSPLTDLPRPATSIPQGCHSSRPVTSRPLTNGAPCTVGAALVTPEDRCLRIDALVERLAPPAVAQVRCLAERETAHLALRAAVGTAGPGQHGQSAVCCRRAQKEPPKGSSRTCQRPRLRTKRAEFSYSVISTRCNVSHGWLSRSRSKMSSGQSPSCFTTWPMARTSSGSCTCTVGEQPTSTAVIASPQQSPRTSTSGGSSFRWSVGGSS